MWWLAVVVVGGWQLVVVSCGGSRGTKGGGHGQGEQGSPRCREPKGSSYRGAGARGAKCSRAGAEQGRWAGGPRGGQTGAKGANGGRPRVLA